MAAYLASLLAEFDGNRGIRKRKAVEDASRFKVAVPEAEVSAAGLGPGHPRQEHQEQRQELN